MLLHQTCLHLNLSIACACELRQLQDDSKVETPPHIHHLNLLGNQHPTSVCLPQNFILKSLIFVHLGDVMQMVARLPVSYEPQILPIVCQNAALSQDDL